MTEAVLFGSYELLDRIAEGGMAEVWRARSRGVAGFEKTVVIKRVLPALMAHQSFAALLIREAKIAARLSHPNIVQIYDLGEERGAYFIAMEHVHGKDLGAVLALADGAGGRDGLPLALDLWIVAEAAKALDYAHRRRGADGRPLNIVHRDVSPQNILLAFEGAVKVADFGIALADERELGREEDPRLLRGKYAYMSPEQARGEPLDRRSDLFSLGIVLWEAVCGRRLFRAETSAETLERVRAAEVPPLSAALDDAPPGLERIVRRALAADPDDRYASAAVMHAELSQVLFDMGATVDESDLAEAMTRLFPEDERPNPNKLDVDLLLRAWDDATAVSDAGLRLEATPTAESTRAFPSSRRIRAETRPVVLLATPEREADAAIFEAVTRSLGGSPLTPMDGVREALFGHGAGSERAGEHAARAALELRRRLALDAPVRVDPVPPLAITSGEATFYDASSVEPSAELHDRTVSLLSGRWPGEIRVEEPLRRELARTFCFSEGDPPLLEGFRARTDRDASELRRRAPLLGRREEVRRLGEALSEASRGRGSAHLLVGAPGSGKSRLIAEVRTLAATGDVVVAEGRGDEAEQGRSYGALAALFRDLCQVEDEDPPQARFAKVERLRVLGLAPFAVRQVGELLGLAYPVAPARRLGRPRAIDLMVSARRAVEALSRERPVLLVLEDLHWMDDPTRHILPLLLRGLRGARVVTVLTARLGTPLPRLDARLLPLEPLDGESAGRLFAHRVGARAVEEPEVARVIEETGGNPRWIEVMADGLRQAGALDLSDGLARLEGGAETPLGPAEVAATGARLAPLRPGDRDLLRVAALFDEGVPLEVLAELHGAPVDVAQAPIRRLLAARLLVPADGTPALDLGRIQPGRGAWGGGSDAGELPKTVSVPGRLLRRAMLETVSEGERRRLHGRAVAVLERLGAADDPARLDQVAHHAARSNDPRRAPDYLLQAAQAARRAGEPGRAARRFAEAAVLVRDDPGAEPGAALELALHAAESALEANDVALAERALTAVEPGAAEGDAAVAVRMALARARAAGRRDAWTDAVFAMAAASDAIDATEDRSLRAQALLEWGLAQLEAGQPGAAVGLLERLLADEGADGAGPVQGRARCARAIALARLGRLDDADAAVAAALALAARLGASELRHLSLAAMAEAALARGKLEEAGTRFHEAAEVARALDAVDHEARLEALAAAVWIEAGAGERAVAPAERAAREGRRHRLMGATQLALAVQGALAVASHADPAARDRIGQSAARLEAAGRWAEGAHALQMLALAHRLLGDGDASREALRRAVDLSLAAGHAPMAARLRRQVADAP